MNDSLSPTFGYDLWFVRELYAGQKNETPENVGIDKNIVHSLYLGISENFTWYSMKLSVNEWTIVVVVDVEYDGMR